MADNVPITPGTGANIAADEVTDSTLGTVKAQYIKVMDGTIDSTNKLVIDSSGRLTVISPTGGGQSLLFGVINTASSGNNTLVAAQAGARIKVVSYVLVAAGTVNVTFVSGTTPNLSGAMPLIANSGVSAQGSTTSHLFQTAVGAALTLNLSAAIQVSGHYSYYVE